MTVVVIQLPVRHIQRMIQEVHVEEIGSKIKSIHLGALFWREDG